MNWKLIGLFLVVFTDKDLNIQALPDLNRRITTPAG